LQKVPANHLFVASCLHEPSSSVTLLSLVLQVSYNGATISPK
jgi:hypothetical protein